MDDKITPIGLTNFRNKRTKFGIKLDDRRRHMYVIGKTGSGKTTLLEHMVISDILAGHGVGVVDPHGEFAEKMLDFVPEERIDDVVYFNPADMEYPIAFNPMEQVGDEFRHLVASGLMGVFKKIWPDAWSARMEYILNNTLLALLELPDSTLLSIMRMFAEPNYRKKVVEHIKDPVIKAFWTNEFARYTQRLESEALAAIQNKIGQLISNPLIRNVLGQAHSTIKMRDVLDKKKILIVNLSKGRIGEDNSRLLGAMIITRLQLAAMSRVDVPEEARPDFFLYVDEFQNFATESFANILSEARKYRLSLILAHQYIGQLVDQDNTRVRDAVFGNVGTITSFRVGAPDAEFLEKEFMPEFLQNDLVNLPKANVYIKLMIDGIASRPFSAETVPPASPPLPSYRDVIIENSQKHYGTSRKVVEEKIASEWNEEAEQMMEKRVERRDEHPLAHVLGNTMGPVRHQDRSPSETARGLPARPSSRFEPRSFGTTTPTPKERGEPPARYSPASPPAEPGEAAREAKPIVDGRGELGRSEKTASGPRGGISDGSASRPREGNTFPSRSNAPSGFKPPVAHSRPPNVPTKGSSVPIGDVKGASVEGVLKRNPPKLPSERFQRPVIDTEALRRAINASLSKNNSPKEPPVGKSEHEMPKPEPLRLKPENTAQEKEENKNGADARP